MKRLFTLGGLAIIITALISACYNRDEIFLPDHEDDYEHTMFLSYCSGNKACLDLHARNNNYLGFCLGQVTTPS